LSFLVVQHAPWEGPGRHLLEAAQASGATLEVWRAWEGGGPPAPDFDGVIALGGPPNVTEDDRYPYLTALKALIRDWLAEGKPYLGFCLGHQFLAHVLGGEVGPQRRSIGFADVELSEAGAAHPIFAGLPKRMRLFKWHGQGARLPLPGGVELLATSAACPVEAISIRGLPQVVGMQFDLHAESELDARKWLAADAAWLAGGPEPVDGEAIIEEARRQEAEAARLFGLLWRNFCALVRRGRG
jgi:GMP synthase-like glutamine amidotransferase